MVANRFANVTETMSKLTNITNISNASYDNSNGIALMCATIRRPLTGNQMRSKRKSAFDFLLIVEGEVPKT